MVEYAHAGMYGPGTFEDVNRNLMKNTAVTVFLRGTATPATLYTDRTRTVTAPNPFFTDSRGNGYFYANPGEYDVSYAGISLPVAIPLDAEDMAAQLPAGGGAFKYTFSTTIADADPGTNTLRLNNATVASATQIFINDLSDAGVDLQQLFATLDDSNNTIRAVVELLSPNGTNLAVFNVTGAVTDAAGYYKIPVAFVAGNAGFLNNQDVYVRFIRVGNKGDTGAPGADGVDGAPGTDGVDGAPGAPGADGTDGVDGTDGATGPAGPSGGGISIPYTFSTTTTDADPGAGTLRLNTATQSSATVVRADVAAVGGADITALLDSFDDSTSDVKGHLRIADPTNPSTFITFNVTAVASPSGYRNISVTMLAASSANPFTNGQAVMLYFTRAGDKGDLLVNQSWVPLSKYGVLKDSATDNQTAIEACISEAVTVGSAGVVDDLLPAVVGDHATGSHILFSGRPDFGNKRFMGLGVEFTQLRGTLIGSGLDFNKIGNTVKYGGGGECFTMHGGPFGSPGVANRPLVVGILTMPYFRQVRVWNALSGADGVSFLVSTTQNGQFDTIWAMGGDVPLRFDRGASANIFLKPEVSGAAKNMVEYRATTTSPPGQQPYCVYNELIGGIIEAPLSTTQCMVRSYAGALNALRSMTVSVNAPAFGGTNPSGATMPSIIRCEATESVQASMIIDQCKLNGGDVAGIVGVDSVIAGALGAARVHVSDGSMGNMTLGGRGAIMIGHPAPWFFGTVTTKWDNTGITTGVPHFERTARDYFLSGTGVSDIVTVSQIAGESNVRWYDRADGTRVIGPGGSSGTDSSLGRIATENGVGKVGNVTGYLGTPASSWNGLHFVMGLVHFWVDAAGNLRLKGSPPSSDTDGLLAGGFLSAAAWNGAHQTWGSHHLWVDSSGRLRIKSSAPTSDTDGAIVGTQS